MCGIDPCPLLAEVRRQLPQANNISIEAMSGPSPPSIFVGRYGYPKVSVGPQATPLLDSTEGHLTPADPAELYGRPLEEVAARHASLVRGRHVSSVKAATRPDRVLATTQEVAMAAKDVDVEMEFEGKLALGSSPTFDSLSSPLGHAIGVNGVEITSNPLIPKKVDSVIDETDLLATDAVNELGDAGIGEAHLTRLLSGGLLGTERRRRMVPTRWAITATDDMLSKQLFDKVREYPSIDKFEVYQAEYLDNHFSILLTPNPWAFEMVEVWMQGSLWADGTTAISDHEEGKPRTSYASNVTGAYYSARLGIMESFEERRKFASAFVWRDIGPGYWAPVGVWLIRETVRDAMRTEPKIFDSLDEAISNLSKEVSVPDRMRNSWFVKRGVQTRISDW